ncbi:MAG TPA: UDP-N-acetylmuramate dehydrogenase, partial [Prevotellaceae bacterium]|nr:UDP-N-acetylmuramate dehydrogenase [Prevotellaceae bacterium]
MQTFKNASLLKRNTFGIDQRCDELVVYQNEGDARALALDARWQTIPYLLLGGGSNLLLTRDFPGLVITPEKRFDVRVEQENDQEVVLRCWAGTTFDDVVAYAVRHGWYGMENLSLIPGECGASAVQNIGAYGAEAKDIIVNVEAVELATGKTVVMMADECGYSYRQSRFKHEWK